MNKILKKYKIQLSAREILQENSDVFLIEYQIHQICQSDSN